MLDDGLVLGAIVLQSYDQPKRYTLEDQALLQFVSHHILIALTRRQARDELERRVEAVSYTHLDVYKRQTPPCVRVWMRLNTPR